MKVLTSILFLQMEETKGNTTETTTRNSSQNTNNNYPENTTNSPENIPETTNNYPENPEDADPFKIFNISKQNIHLTPEIVPPGAAAVIPHIKPPEPIILTEK